jgi:hybrid cluster-associated redox disulfide protein
MSADKKIHLNTTLSEAMRDYPATVEVFIRYGLHCVGCEVAALETVEMAAATHGVKNIQQLLEDLNRAAG